MAVIRVNKTKDFTVMSNYHFKDRSISLKAKGLLSQMLSLPDDWDYTLNGLSCLNKDSISAIKSALNELKESGYLVITKIYPDKTESGRIEYIYDIYEIPQKQEGKKQGIENLPLEILPVEIQPVENQPQLNTNKSNTKRLNTKELITNYTEDVELQEALKDFVEMRKKIKKPMTERAMKLILRKLDNMEYTTEGKIAILNNAIEHCWQSIYPLKENALKPQNKAEERLGWIDDIR